MESAVRRDDVVALLAVVSVPILLALPALVGYLQVDPLFTAASIDVGGRPGILGGRPYIDPNAGFQTQALGHESFRQWLSGEVPWWNHFSGVGLPLAAEYQPAAFFPLAVLTLLPLGMAWLHVVLQGFAGAGTFLALRALGVQRRAAAVGGILFALNGTGIWLPYGPGAVAPWLPWFVYGIERARGAASAKASGGWRVLALALAASLLAGFPETAYIDGLLCLLWAIVRGFPLEARVRSAFAGRIVAGGSVGVLLAAPQLVAFFGFLGDAEVAGHADMSHAALAPLSAVGALVAPYAFGPIFAYHDAWPFVGEFWGSAGGYVTSALVAAAVFGFWMRRDALAWALMAWVMLALGKSFLVEPAVTLWNLVPGIRIAAFARYAQPSWAFALIVLAARALDPPLGAGTRNARIAAGCVAVAAWGCAAVALLGHAQELAASRGLANSAIASIAWAALTAGGVVLALGARLDERAQKLAAAVLVVDAALMALIPMLSATRGREVNHAPIEFLRSNLGLHRFFTLGPIAPNYGAYFGIASVNHNYLPVPKRWVRGVQARFDPTQDPIVFNGWRSLPAARDNVGGLRSLGVRYVVAPPGANPYAGRDDVQVAYRDATLTIFELPSPAPYWQADPPCRLSAHGRDAIELHCDAPSTIVRRELYDPGWSASLGSGRARVDVHEDLFQAVRVPAGSATLRFSYAPAYAGVGWALMWAACAALLGSLVLSRAHGVRSRVARVRVPST